ncbi:hypothetical protein EVAR_75773_1 [Eumeta japonica]|uniref:Uncharacterized protein n=1 Tax=Eumeta variegata TaxID=151549 RepID=A0A4C1TCW5_EUMVA|nr:hypothetical protein EVAR_75773_1 [Eumeta japonica]
MTENNIGAVQLTVETDKRVIYQQIWSSLGIRTFRLIHLDVGAVMLELWYGLQEDVVSVVEKGYGVVVCPSGKK